MRKFDHKQYDERVRRAMNPPQPNRGVALLQNIKQRLLGGGRPTEPLSPTGGQPPLM